MADIFERMPMRPNDQPAMVDVQFGETIEAVIGDPDDPRSQRIWIKVLPPRRNKPASILACGRDENDQPMPVTFRQPTLRGESQPTEELQAVA